MLDSIRIYLYDIEEYGYLNFFNTRTFIGNLLMLQNFPKFDLSITTFGSGRPLRTLSIEWWLYMSFGLIISRSLNTI